MTLLSRMNLSDVGSLPKARQNLGVTTYVNGRTTLAGLNPTMDVAAFLNEAGREGLFIPVLVSSLSTRWAAARTADTAQAVFVNSTFNALYTWMRQIDGPIRDSWFGVKADAVVDGSNAILSGTDDTVAMGYLAAFIKALGGGHFVLDGGIRRVWSSTISHNTFLADIADSEGLVIEYLNEASIHAVHPNSASESNIIGYIWYINGCRDLWILNPRLTNEGATAGAITAGAVHVGWGTSYSQAGRNINVLGVEQYGGLGGVFITAPTSGGDDTAKITKKVNVSGSFQRTFKPVDLQGSGDDHDISVVTDECGRAVFAYNVNKGRIYAEVYRPVLTSGCVNITCYDSTNLRPVLSEIDVYVVARGGWGADPSVSGIAQNTMLCSLNLVHTDGSGVRVSGVRYHLDVHFTSNAAGSKVIALHKYDNSGVSTADGTGRGHVVQGVVWSGIVQGAFSGAVEPFNFCRENPLGTENFTGDTVIGCGFRDFYAPGSDMDVNFDGSGVSGTTKFFIENSYFGGSAHSFTNATGKVNGVNSSIASM